MHDSGKSFLSAVRLMAVAGRMILTIMLVGSAAMFVGSAVASAGPLPPASAEPSLGGIPRPSVAAPGPSTTDRAKTAPVAAQSGPQLSIAIDNGQTSAVTGDKLTYTVTVKNLGANAVTGLVVSQTMPTGLKLVSADSSGTAKSGKVTWPLSLKVAATATFHTTMLVGSTPAELLRLASVACASLAANGAPIVCAAHSDQLPAGAAGQAAGAPADRTWWYVGGGIAVIVVVAAATLIVVRRRSARVAG